MRRMHFILAALSSAAFAQAAPVTPITVQDVESIPEFTSAPLIPAALSAAPAVQITSADTLGVEQVPASTLALNPPVSSAPAAPLKAATLPRAASAVQSQTAQSQTVQSQAAQSQAAQNARPAANTAASPAASPTASPTANTAAANPAPGLASAAREEAPAVLSTEQREAVTRNQITEMELKVQVDGAERIIVGLRPQLGERPSVIKATRNGQALNSRWVEDQQILAIEVPGEGGVIQIQSLGFKTQPTIELAAVIGGRMQSVSGSLRNVTFDNQTSVTESEGLIRRPLDTSTISRATRVITQWPKGSSFDLVLNGAIVPETQIGEEQITSDARREYLGLNYRPGPNVLEVRRGADIIEQRTVWLPDVAVSARIEGLQLKADGVSPLQIRVTAIDQHGVTTALPLVSVGGVTPLNADSDPTQSGMQLKLNNGSAVLELPPTSTPGTLKFALDVNGHSVPAQVNVGAAQREMIAGHASTELTPSGAKFDAKITLWAPLAGGQLQLKVNTDQRSDVTPQRFGTAADASIITETLRSSGPVAADYQHPAFSVRYAQGAAKDPVTEQPGAGDSFSLRSADLSASPGETRLTYERLAALGGEAQEVLNLNGTRSATLSQRLQQAAAAGGLRIEVVTYSDDRRSEELERRTLVRGQDYLIDDSGTVNFGRPYWSRDAEGHLVDIVATGRDQTLRSDVVALTHENSASGERVSAGLRADQTSEGERHLIAGVQYRRSGQQSLQISGLMDLGDTAGRPEGRGMLLRASGTLAGPRSPFVPERPNARVDSADRIGVTFKARYQMGEPAIPGIGAQGYDLQGQLSVPLRPEQQSSAAGIDWNAASIQATVSARLKDEEANAQRATERSAQFGLNLSAPVYAEASADNGSTDVGARLGTIKAEVSLGAQNLGSQPIMTSGAGLSFENTDWRASLRATRAANTTVTAEVRRDVTPEALRQQLDLDLVVRSEATLGDSVDVSSRFGLEGRRGPFTARAFYQHSPEAPNGVNLQAEGSWPIDLGQEAAKEGRSLQATISTNAETGRTERFGTQLSLQYRTPRLNASVGVESGWGAGQGQALRSAVVYGLSPKALSDQDERAVAFDGLSLWNAQGSGHRYGVSYSERGAQRTTLAYLRYRSGNQNTEGSTEITAEFERSWSLSQGQIRQWVSARAQPGDLSGAVLNIGVGGTYWMRREITGNSYGVKAQQETMASSALNYGAGLRAEANWQPILGTVRWNLSPELSLRLMPGVVISGGYRAVYTNSWQPGTPYLRLDLIGAVNTEESAPLPEAASSKK